MTRSIRPRRTEIDLKLSEKEFRARYLEHFKDPNFESVSEEISKIAEIAWNNYSEGRKAPSTYRAGDGFADPEYELSTDWIKARAAIYLAQEEYDDPGAEARVLIVIGSDRNENTCPSEMSKTQRLADIADKTLRELNIDTEILDLSRITAEYGKTIYPCKGCVSTAMPLCHWPCSCYPNHSLGQVHDWMNEIYPKWVRAHGVMIISPVYWHQAPSALKLMIDRLVCADGGNEDPTSTNGKDAKLAKEIELNGWHYPRHLCGRLFSVIVHGDVIGVNELKNALVEWMQEMEMIPAGLGCTLSRYIGYMESYAESHEALDRDEAVQQEVRNAALGLAVSVYAKKAGKLNSENYQGHDPRPK